MPSTSSNSGTSESANQERFSGEDDASSISEENGSPREYSNLGKRKSSEDVAESVSKRQRSFPYYPKYHDLYNATVEEATCPLDANNIDRWKPGRIGLSHWSSEEKEAFFVALDKKGRDDIKGISSFIGSKSEIEVRCFVLGLQEGLTKNAQDGTYLEIPAAYEVSEQCEKELNLAAQGLAQRQLAVEEVLEQKRCGHWWLLNHDTATELEAPPGEDILAAVNQELARAMGLFDVAQMFDLSSRFFMNSKDMNENWTTWLDGKSGPGIYGTALVDLYGLVVGIVRRILASSIFLAECRHGQQKIIARRADRPILRSQDIKSACQLLGLDKTQRDFWIGLARRCNLDVYNDDGLYHTSQTSLSYDEVEQCLASDPQATSKSTEQSSPAGILAHTTDIAATSHNDHVDEESEETVEECEHLDAMASWHEEVRLWRAMGKDESNNAVEDVGSLFDEGVYQIEVAKDWRRDFNYRPQWQSSTDLPSETIFRSTADQRPRKTTRTAQVSPTDNRQSLASDTVGEESSESEIYKQEDSDKE